LARVKVTINKKGHIPSLGVGPFRRPILISQELCDHLIKLGYPVKIIKSPVETKIAETSIPETPPQTDVVTDTTTAEVIEPAADETVVEPSVEEEKVAEETTIEETIEEVTPSEDDSEEETTEDEIIVNDLDLGANSYYTVDFLTSKSRCKKILAARTVQYDTSSTLELLQRLVLDSNPEGVELVEE
jgi:hypothetical protein